MDFILFVDMLLVPPNDPGTSVKCGVNRFDFIFIPTLEPYMKYTQK